VLAAGAIILTPAGQADAITDLGQPTRPDRRARPAAGPAGLAAALQAAALRSKVSASCSYCHTRPHAGREQGHQLCFVLTAAQPGSTDDI